ncbi:MAG: 30S ribosomal protein S9 [Euryarchaeota archaeon HGW-Euryarchaeota-1]|nr:MAG: 30S ribosomal protein S9 [Euryarchaeota archaeon HGW-Euryarchaeota-1]
MEEKCPKGEKKTNAMEMAQKKNKSKKTKTTFAQIKGAIMAAKKSSKETKIVGLGKRKAAVARTYLKSGSGKVIINNIPVELLNSKVVSKIILEPIIAGKEITDDFLKDKDIYVSIVGGGVIGQAQAARTAIGQLLLQSLPSDKAKALKEVYNQYARYLYISDVRVKQPRHFGYKARSKKQQKSYR